MHRCATGRPFGNVSMNCRIPVGFIGSPPHTQCPLGGPAVGPAPPGRGRGSSRRGSGPGSAARCSPPGRGGGPGRRRPAPYSAARGWRGCEGAPGGGRGRQRHPSPVASNCEPYFVVNIKEIVEKCWVTFHSPRAALWSGGGATLTFSTSERKDHLPLGSACG